MKGKEKPNKRKAEGNPTINKMYKGKRALLGVESGPGG